MRFVVVVSHQVYFSFASCSCVAIASIELRALDCMHVSKNSFKVWGGCSAHVILSICLAGLVIKRQVSLTVIILYYTLAKWLQFNIPDITFQVWIQQFLEGAIENVVLVSHCPSRHPKLIKNNFEKTPLMKQMHVKPKLPYSRSLLVNVCAGFIKMAFSFINPPSLILLTCVSFFTNC